jgi:hypothetical protein
LLNLIEGLPSDSAYAEASAQDDELAEMMAARGDAPTTGPRVTEFGPTNQLLTAILDRLGEVVKAAAGDGSVKIPLSPRPETAADRYARRMQDAAYEYLLEQVEEAQARSEALDEGDFVTEVIERDAGTSD